jgi:hypothetical protein
MKLLIMQFSPTFVHTYRPHFQSSSLKVGERESF